MLALFKWLFGTMSDPVHVHVMMMTWMFTGLCCGQFCDVDISFVWELSVAS
jgi:hypothetical protein